MASITRRADIDRITAEAVNVRVGRSLLTLIAALLYLVGWTAAKVSYGLWIALVWSFTAIRIGWQDAQTTSRLRHQRGTA
jgi:hypothetical protein